MSLKSPLSILPLAALLACAGANFEFLLELVGDKGPLLGAVLLNELHDSGVFLDHQKAYVVRFTSFILLVLFLNTTAKTERF